MYALPEKDRQTMRERFQNAKVDAESFQLKFAWCELEQCRGTCCRGGVWLEPEEAEFIRTNEAELRSKLAAIGLTIDPQAPLLDESQVMGRFKAGTNTKPFDYSDQPQLAAGLEQTACIFRRDDGACGLQLLAVSEGKHPWHYKPLYCFLYPIDISDSPQPVIGLEDDPQDDFASKTTCGRINPEGRPGYEIFARELGALSDLIGRDLLAEIKAESLANEPLRSSHKLASNE